MHTEKINEIVTKMNNVVAVMNNLIDENKNLKNELESVKADVNQYARKVKILNGRVENYLPYAIEGSRGGGAGLQIK